jgi:hypothetical protein
VKITTAAHGTYGAGRAGDYDDLVLALAIAWWQAGRPHPAPQYSSFTYSCRRS